MEYQSTAMKNDQNEAEKIAIKGRQAINKASDNYFLRSAAW